MIGRTILNYDELKNGHTFFGVIFHNSGFSMELANDADILQSFIVNPSRKIENIRKLLDMKTRNDRMLKNRMTRLKRGEKAGLNQFGTVF